MEKEEDLQGRGSKRKGAGLCQEEETQKQENHRGSFILSTVKYAVNTTLGEGNEGNDKEKEKANHGHPIRHHGNRLAKH